MCACKLDRTAAIFLSRFHEAVDAAVGKTLADFASCFFPWIDKACGDLMFDIIDRWIWMDLMIFEGYLMAWSWR